MKGVILAGGLGTRLAPLTQITNKHLLPVWNMPMVHYPIQNLVKSGIEEIMIVTGGQHAGHFLNVLKNGKDYNLRKLEYAYQEGEGGIAEALKLARDFVGADRFCVMLGDNIYQYNAKNAVKWFSENTVESMVLTQDPAGYDPTRFGIAVLGPGSGRPEQIIEKPSKKMLAKMNAQRRHCSILTGTYFYTPDVFEVCDRLVPSQRGELEISDVNQHYLERQQLELSQIAGWWSDAGTFPSLLQVSNQVKADGANKDYHAV